MSRGNSRGPAFVCRHCKTPLKTGAGGRPVSRPIFEPRTWRLRSKLATKFTATFDMMMMMMMNIYNQFRKFGDNKRKQENKEVNRQISGRGHTSTSVLLSEEASISTGSTLPTVHQRSFSPQLNWPEREAHHVTPYSANVLTYTDPMVCCFR